MVVSIMVSHSDISVDGITEPLSTHEARKGNNPVRAFIRRFFSSFNPPEPVIENPLEQSLVNLERMINGLDIVRLVSTPTRIWRSTPIESLHPDMYHLIRAVELATQAIVYDERPDPMVTRSRSVAEFIHSKTLKSFLIDYEGRAVDSALLFDDLKRVTLNLIDVIKQRRANSETQFDYALRQTHHLVGEIEYVLSQYLEARE